MAGIETDVPDKEASDRVPAGVEYAWYLLLEPSMAATRK
jgi:hypothetical protein